MTNITQTAVAVAVASFFLGVVLFSIHNFFQAYVRSRTKEDPNFDTTFIYFLKRVLELFIWTLGILLILQNIGIQISALIGGLGISGIAVAFAVQNVLKDIFSSVSIYFDRPFKLGDKIQVGADTGTVQKIGLKSTRLLTLQGEELIISNKELTDSRVLNFRNVKHRRVVFGLSISCKTPLAKIKDFPTVLKKSIEEQPRTRFVRAHLKSLESTSLVYEAVYFIDTDEYKVFMDIQEAVNLAILEECARQKIEFTAGS
jgi:small-conductance mechanosensitive channel